MEEEKFYYLYYAGLLMGTLKEKRRRKATNCTAEERFLFVTVAQQKRIHRLLKFLCSRKDVHTIIYYKEQDEIKNKSIIVGLTDVNNYYEKIGQGFIIYNPKEE